MSFRDLGDIGSLAGSFALLTINNFLHKVLLGHSDLSVIGGFILGVVRRVECTLGWLGLEAGRQERVVLSDH